MWRYKMWRVQQNTCQVRCPVPALLTDTSSGRCRMPEPAGRSRLLSRATSTGADPSEAGKGAQVADLTGSIKLERCEAGEGSKRAQVTDLAEAAKLERRKVGEGSKRAQ